VLQCVAVCCNVLQCVVVCCSALQCVAVCRNVSQHPHASSSRAAPTKKYLFKFHKCHELFCVFYEDPTKRNHQSSHNWQRLSITQSWKVKRIYKWIFLNTLKKKIVIHPNSTPVTVILSAEPLRVANSACTCVCVSFIFLVCLIHLCDMPQLHACHDPFICPYSHIVRALRARMEKSHSKRHELVDCPIFTIAR